MEDVEELDEEPPQVSILVIKHVTLSMLTPLLFSGDLYMIPFVPSC